MPPWSLSPQARRNSRSLHYRWRRLLFSRPGTSRQWSWIWNPEQWISTSTLESPGKPPPLYPALMPLRQVRANKTADVFCLISPVEWNEHTTEIAKASTDRLSGSACGLQVIKHTGDQPLTTCQSSEMLLFSLSDIKPPARGQVPIPFLNTNGKLEVSCSQVTPDSAPSQPLPAFSLWAAV